MAVKVKRERPDQRRHHRVTAPLHVDVGGVRVRATDWSLGGLRIDDYPGAIPAMGETLALGLSLPFQGFDVSFDANAEVVRSDPSRAMFAVQFTQLGERERELMSHFIEELVRGSMVNVEDTIQRIDVPVTPASLEPDVNPKRQVPLKRWPIKTVAMSSFYMMLGLAVLAVTVVLGYSNFYRMEVQTAVIAAPVETVQAQAEGKLLWAGKEPGDQVKAGEVVVKVLDNQVEREIELAEIAVREQQAKLAFMKRRQADELERVMGYATLEGNNVERQKLDVESLEAQLFSARQQAKRLTILHHKGWTTTAKLEEDEKQVATLEKSLASSKVELRSRIELARQNIGKRLYTGENIVGNIGEVEAQVRLAEMEIGLKRETKQALVNHRDRLAVRAPFDGTLLELPRLDDTHIRKGDTIAVIEQRNRRHVLAFLTQDEVNRIGLGDEVTIYIPALKETHKARVFRIDRTSGFVREQDQRTSPGYSWRGPIDRSAKVFLALEDRRVLADRDTYRSGLPVVAIFPRRTTNPLINAIQQKLLFAFSFGA
jgi:multidrug resistance efflux pump